MPFEPINEKSRRVLVLEHLQEKSPGEIATYEELAVLLGMSEPQDRSIIQTTVGQASRALLETKNYAVEAVTNTGYRVVKADEHLRLAKGRQIKASRQLVKGKRVLVHTDSNDLSAEERTIHVQAIVLVGAQLDAVRRLNIRQQNTERALESVTKKQELTDDAVAKLNERLAAVEAKVTSE